METWLRVILVSAGGILGVNARYLVGLWVNRWADPRFPWSTFLINVSGSFVVGVVGTAIASRAPHPFSPHARLFFVVGVLGGYTTFSSYALESVLLWETGSPRRAVAYALGSLAAGLVAVVLGAALARGLFAPPPRPDPPATSPLDPDA